ncbi:CoA ester lyase [Altererythrobacter luteolus]|uniref:CoA ester lyase n=1 Tax=Pontixanthobacter luteolus TaxID=295089 RepID=A0A6I4UZF3_9SPHN|nr:aldolase/citrate lyase family protein [Pontixanthobacter luteolus]MXP47379.1 CoA ester lyase [Pontixanthobacter luteolus]
MRSWLVIEGNKPAKLAKAPMVGADAIVIDLACVPVDDDAPRVREEVAEWLTNFSDPLVAKKAFARWVRIKPMDAPHWREDLVAAMKGAPDGVILPKVTGPTQIRMLASELYEIEQKLALKHNSTKIIPQIGETAEAALTLPSLTGDPQPRLTGFAWNAENVARGLGAKRSRREDGGWTDTMRHVRAMTLILAKAMGVMAIDTATADAADVDLGLSDAREARQDGFTGMFAVHPRQVSAINEAYSLSARERAEAEALLGLFASKPAAVPVEPAEEPAEEPAHREPKGIRALG